MTQPATNFQPREVVVSQPSSNPTTFIGAVPNGTSYQVDVDVALALSDRNRLGNAAGTPSTLLVAAGYFLDASVYSDRAMTLDVLFQINPYASGGGPGTFRSVMPAAAPLAVVAATLTLVAGLRVIGQVVRLVFANASGAGATVEVTTLVRSV